MMCRSVKRLAAAAVVVIGLLSGAFAEELPFNDVIARSARGIEDALPQGAMVAVLNFDSPSKVFSDFAIDELNGQLVGGGKVTIVDRDNLALITEELQLQMSGAVSDELVVSIGRQLGAHYIVTGSLTDIGTGYRFRVKVTGVEKAALLKQISLNLKSDEQVAFLLGKKFKLAEQKPKQEKVIAGSARKTGSATKYVIDKSMDFTTGERWGTWALNVVPGLGSAVIMRDAKGAITNASLGVSGMVLCFIGIGIAFRDDYTVAEDGFLVQVLGVTGLTLWLGGGSAWNIYRSITYHHPDSRVSAANPLQGLNVAVLPDPDGNIKGYVAYRVEF